MATCPTCDRDGFDGAGGVRKHHVQAHGESLSNRECDSCGERFYDENSMRTLCDTCYDRRNGPDSKPEGVTLPDEKQWVELSSYQRYYYKNVDEERRRVQRRSAELREWYRELKRDYECTECGEDRAPALDFHHEGESKNEAVSKMINDGYGKERIMEEIEKCEVLCANCHRVRHHSDRPTLSHHVHFFKYFSSQQPITRRLLRRSVP